MQDKLLFLSYKASLFKVIAVFIALFLVKNSAAQRYNSINYRWEQGFAATNGYIIYQDRKGYIWIGTENGLMRFNGRDFKIYTTRDGLPDNEILGIQEDDQGRLWLLPFANAICYIKDGEVFNGENTPFLKQLDLGTWQQTIHIDHEGTIWTSNKGSLNGLTKKGTIRKIDHVGGNPLSRSSPVIWLGKQQKLMLSMPEASADVYLWRDTGFIKVGKSPAHMSRHLYWDSLYVYDRARNNFCRYALEDGTLTFFSPTNTPLLKTCFLLMPLSDGQLFIASDHGVNIIDVITGRITGGFLAGDKVGTMLKARDGALWIGTIGKGIFRVTKTPVKTIGFTLDRPSVIYIKGTQEGMYGTTDKSVFLEAVLNQKRDIIRETNTRLDSPNDPYRHYVYVGQNGKKEWITCSDDIRLKAESGMKTQGLPGTYAISKAVLEEEERHLLIATSTGVFRLDKERFLVTDTIIYGERTTSVTKTDSIVYAGTLNGLFACYPDQPCKQVLPGNPYLKSHIMALCAGKDHSVWVANSKAELIKLRQDQIAVVIDLKKGLQCNRISCIKSSDTLIWVGTDNGLFAIRQMPPYNIVRHITYATGLNSNQVNCLDIYRGRVWVGTINGVNYFDEKDVFNTRENTRVIINSLKNGERNLPAGATILQLEDKPLAIDFDVVDFSGGSSPIFEYRINDQGDWISLDGNQLYFPTLPYGAFAITIRAFSPNWAEGALFRQQFYNPLPYYRSWWFAGILILLVAVSGGSILFSGVKRARKRDHEKLAVQQNLLLLEQMALQGQMNPHFIFNCIAAIKQYYNIGDIEKANNFVDSFSLLIRQTFEMGTETFVPLDKELNYLAQYLYVEQARFNNSFRYSISKNIESPEQALLVPAMLLQPIVENAVRHGVRHLPDDEGEISIQIFQKEDQITITITDNGIGRRSSAALKEESLLQSLTSSIVNEKRIHILNRLFADKIVMFTEDKTNDQNKPSGTRVILTYPTNINQILKDESNYRRR